MAYAEDLNLENSMFEEELEMVSVRESVVIVGGYGVVGQQIARIFREKNPNIPITMAGRNPEKAQTLLTELAPANVLKIDLDKPNPLAALEDEKPLALVQVVNDPHDYLLQDVIKHQVPFLDITRWTEKFKKAEKFVEEQSAQSTIEAPPIILASGWMAGLASVVARHLATPFKKVTSIDLDILFALKDKAGPNSIEYVDRLTEPFSIFHNGELKMVKPLSDAKKVTFPNGHSTKTYRLDTPDQYSLPMSCQADGVNARIAFDDWFSNQSLMLLVRSGLWSLISSDAFQGLRHKLLFNPGEGAAHELVVDVQGITDEGEQKNIRAEVVDPLGQTHLTAVGAVIQLQRLIDTNYSKGLYPGINLPEQISEESWWLEYLNEQSVKLEIRN